jgi:ArsR family transcriptional regulator
MSCAKGETDSMIPIEKRIDLLKVISHPIRIKILEELTQGVKCVSDFEDSLDISQLCFTASDPAGRTGSLISSLGRLKCYP